MYPRNVNETQSKDIISHTQIRSPPSQYLQQGTVCYPSLIIVPSSWWWKGVMDNFAKKATIPSSLSLVEHWRRSWPKHWHVRRAFPLDLDRQNMLRWLKNGCLVVDWPLCSPKEELCYDIVCCEPMYSINEVIVKCVHWYPMIPVL